MKLKKRNKYVSVLAMVLIPLLQNLSSFGNVKLPKLISDGMILQRNTDVKIWGWAASNEKISIHFIDSTYQTTANNKGEWAITIPELTAGGPFKMQINAENTITINDIMIGDVWICSGQSNMELPMSRVSWIYQADIKNSKNADIRQFYVPQAYNFDEPQKDLQSGKWVAATPDSILNFSATAYFFAKRLYDKYKVPIGLINSSLGGSPAEAWISEKALKKFPDYYSQVQQLKDSALIKRIIYNDSIRINAWYKSLGQKDKGYKTPGEPWYKPSLNTSGWSTIKIPGYWPSAKPGPVNGVVWFRKKVDIPSSMIGKPAKIILGRIVDADSVFINGVFVGTTSYQYPPRRYDIPSGLLKKGENTIAIRVISNRGEGGFVPDKTYEITAGNNSIDLKGDWKYRLGAEMKPLADQTFIRWKPAGLYNAMIAPLLKYKIKGVIWYQGESNAERPADYEKLFTTLISTWRKNWQEGNFPFLYVQLPNYMATKNQPSESNWALLREAQLKTLSLPNTGMAVTIDIGEWNDIHPLDKKDVGYRLALAAENVAYGDKNVVYSGPVYQSMKIEQKKIVLTFTHIGSGLIAKGSGQLKYFAVAGNNKKFEWAKATIKNNKVIVWSKKVSNPVAVRYAWADNPKGANLYNKEGLPASPFRTDDWPVN